MLLLSISQPCFFSYVTVYLGGELLDWICLVFDDDTAPCLVLYDWWLSTAFPLLLLEGEDLRMGYEQAESVQNK